MTTVLSAEQYQSFHDLLRPDQYYAAFGYYVFRNLIPEQAVDDLVEEYKSKVLTSNLPFLRQSSLREPHKFNEHGLMTNTLLNVHVFGPQQTFDGSAFDHFTELLRAVVCGKSVQTALQQLTHFPEHTLAQSMLFEQSATPPHQDFVFLDTKPARMLLAGWIALEDISPRATRFWVLPGSGDFKVEFTEEQVYKTGEYTRFMEDMFEREWKDKIVIPPMNKGDVLFWNSHTVHGSVKGEDASLSRRSLAVHYIPSDYNYGNPFRTAEKIIERDGNGMDFLVPKDGRKKK